MDNRKKKIERTLNRADRIINEAEGEWPPMDVKWHFPKEAAHEFLMALATAPKERGDILNSYNDQFPAVAFIQPGETLQRLGYRRISDTAWEHESGVRAKARILDGRLTIDFV